VGYTIHVPANKRGSGYQLEYSVVSGNEGGAYKEKGYFSLAGTSADKAKTSIIDVSSKNSTGNDMTLLADTMVPVDAIMLDKYQVTIQSGKTVNLKVKYLPENATNKTIKWTSGNTNVAEVSSRCCQGKSNGNVSYNCKNSQRSNNSIYCQSCSGRKFCLEY